MPELRRAGPQDVAGVASMLARAFVDDPVASHLFPPAGSRERALRRFFQIQLRQNYLRRGEVWVEDRLRCSALWMPPKPRSSGLDEVRLRLALLPALGGRLGAARRLARLLTARHPRIPHWYLGTLGTDPAHRRQGLATAVLEPVLRRCDVSGTAAYLESSREENVAFYAGQGFEVIGEVAVPEGPTLWLMWRRAARG